MQVKAGLPGAAPGAHLGEGRRGRWWAGPQRPACLRCTSGDTRGSVESGVFTAAPAPSRLWPEPQLREQEAPGRTGAGCQDGRVRLGSPRLDGFILTERLGSGTYATVYKAYAKVPGAPPRASIARQLGGAKGNFGSGPSAPPD